jgi:anthranilate synthase component 2
MKIGTQSAGCGISAASSKALNGENLSRMVHLECTAQQRSAAISRQVICATLKTSRFCAPITLSTRLHSRVTAQAADQQVASNDGISPRKVVVIDNYDSFTYNLCQYLGDLGCDYEVFRNDEISIEELKERNPRGILVSPGPGAPKDSGVSMELFKQLGSEVPIFGVCMGLQCMAEAFGGKIVRAPNGVVHGKTSPVHYDEHGEEGLMQGLPNPFIACRYHSLVVEKESFPHEELEITAWTEDGLIMAIRHKKFRNLQAVQFHPESIITQEGKKIVANFLRILKLNDNTRTRQRVFG